MGQAKPGKHTVSLLATHKLCLYIEQGTCIRRLASSPVIRVEECETAEEARGKSTRQNAHLFYVYLCPVIHEGRCR